MNACDRRGPLSRTGTAQPDRDMAERRADHFHLDERDVADLILFGRRFARYLRYYAPDGTPTGDWSSFFDSDISAILASIARLPVDPFRRALADAQSFLEADPGRPEAELRAHFTLSFHLPLALVQELTQRLTPLAPEHPLWRSLTRQLGQTIAPRLADLARYHQGGVTAGVIDTGPLDPADFTIGANAGPGIQIADEVANIVFGTAAFEDVTLPLHIVQGFAPTGWPDFYTAQDPDPSPYADGADTYARIFDALNYNLLSSSIERVFQALSRARSEANAQLAESLENFASHTPHYGLWLAFLSMFDRAQTELNDLTGRHMDFYFEEVLRLALKPPEADHVHLLVDLARGTEAHLLPAGTLLRGGKDASGTDVTYALEEDFVANRAQVADLKAVSVDTTMFAGLPYTRVRAAPVAMSADGLGAELPKDAPHFAPFGPADSPFARVGFAVADRQLLLREGTRGVEIRFTTTQPGALSPMPGFRIRLTTEDGWLELPHGSAFTATFSAGQVVFNLSLSGDHPAIVPHDPEVHQGPYPAGIPVAEILLDWDGAEIAASRAMALFRNASRGAIQIRTHANGLRQMTIRTDDGTADPASGFLPFGAVPRRNGTWIIGSAEVFCRPLESLSLKVTWAAPYSQGLFFDNVAVGNYRVGFDYLFGGNWTSGSTATVSLDLGGAGARTLAAKGVDSAPSDAELTLEDPEYDATQRTGFMRMTLNRDFGHAHYLDAKTLALIALASGAEPPPDPTETFTDVLAAGGTPSVSIVYNASGLPQPPFTPEVAEITLEYQAKQQAAAQVWLLHPFGVEPDTGPGRILPDLPFEGALFIGVDALDPPERLSLLMQVADGTGDPLLDLPTLDHAYLGRNAWTSFKNQDVIDRTGDLAGSGLLSYAMPDDAAIDAPQMPGGLHWLRVSAAENPAAVNRLHMVAAQGVRAVFTDNGNDPAFLDTPLPAGTISKLLIPDPAVKGLTQPFASFGGRGPEDRPRFHRRVSERLRHKDRAVTMWDHEHLALEAQPNLYRVKCLNHTELQRQNGSVVADNELAPGAVTVVAVPYVLDIEPRDPLRPYADRATLTALHDHLAKRCSPFVRLETTNPKFEEIHIRMNVAFRDGIADTDFYRKEIEEALILHLTPWQRQGAAGVEFGGQVYKSTIIDFVEELAYVDFLEDVQMFHRPKADGPVPPIDLDIIRATTARSVLVSARSHVIGLV
ncbi:hypothetical protein [Tateyamaria sp. syn59]|uniref:hypothetical protein n=1 Tax=Tateyamaria sp. syn59 TaxID=2576942 RepID=UPI0011BD8E67|nr:hypothetical protein [Tateyamaria sp. syn59]